MTDSLTPETTVTPHSTGRVLGPARSSLLVVELHWTWYRRHWKATVVSSIGLPVLYLLALGVGFGTQVRSSAVVGGGSYLSYIAPALLASTAVQNAADEGTFPIVAGFNGQKHFVGIATTPITTNQMLAGEFIWMGLRMVFSCLAFLAIAAALGAVTGPGIMLSLVFAVLCGMGFAAPVVAYSATVAAEHNDFSVLFRFVVLPMTLLAGTLFPISRLPAWIHPVAWITPLWHGTELARGAALGTLSTWPTVGHIAFLLAMFAVGSRVARAKFRTRLVR